MNWASVILQHKQRQSVRSVEKVRGVSEEPSAEPSRFNPPQAEAESPERRTKTQEHSKAIQSSAVSLSRTQTLHDLSPSLLLLCCLSLISPPLSLPPPLPVSRSAFSHFLEVAELRKTPRIPGLLREEAGLQLLMSLCCCR